MARRSRSKKFPVAPVLLGVVVLVLLGLAIKFLSGPKNPEGTALPLETYVSDGNSLRGNTYQVSGEIKEKPFHDPGVGQKIYLSAEVDPARYPANLPKEIGIFIPADITGPNLETRQSYQFDIKIGPGGDLEATAYRSK